jgi:hypothetical protein
VDLPGKWKFLIESLALFAVGAGDAPYRKNRVYMTHSRPPGQCWHTSEMAAIRWAYRLFGAVGHAGFPGRKRLLNGPHV